MNKALWALWQQNGSWWLLNWSSAELNKHSNDVDDVKSKNHVVVECIYVPLVSGTSFELEVGYFEFDNCNSLLLFPYIPYMLMNKINQGENKLTMIAAM